MKRDVFDMACTASTWTNMRPFAQPAKRKKINLALVLAVDDDPAILRLLSSLLRLEGYSVRVAERGEQAVDAIKAESPDLVVLDLGLPDMDGRIVAALARDSGYRNPILLLSARSDLAAVSAEIGAQAYLQKPFDPDALIQRVLLLLTPPSAVAAT